MTQRQKAAIRDTIIFAVGVAIGIAINARERHDCLVTSADVLHFADLIESGAPPSVIPCRSFE